MRSLLQDATLSLSKAMRPRSSPIHRQNMSLSNLIYGVAAQYPVRGFSGITAVTNDKGLTIETGDGRTTHL